MLHMPGSQKWQLTNYGTCFNMTRSDTEELHEVLQHVKKLGWAHAFKTMIVQTFT